MRIVIVDDDAGLRRLFGRFLDGHNVETYPTADGLLNLECWADVDVAIVDLMYRNARVSGFDLLAWLKEHTKVRRVLVTGGYRNLDRTSLEMLADVVLIKPVDQAMLTGALL